MPTPNTSLEVIQNDISYIKSDIKEIKDSVVTGYVTKDQFEPVKRIVYGLVGLILTSVVVAIVTLVLK
jgi:hypothetical protein